MKLVRWGNPGLERPGAVDSDGNIRDLTGVVGDISQTVLLPDGLAMLTAVELQSRPIVPADTRLGPCIGAVGKLVCIGKNYAEHARETGAEPPTEPVIFMKATSSIAGPCDDLQVPLGSTKLDYEVELGVVIGAPAKNVAGADALAHVAGYCVVCDYSERAFQLESTGQWVKGKSADGFGPLGPWLVTADEVADPQALRLWLKVNGEARQGATTAEMIFGVAHLVSYVSAFMSLQPGDVIATGTPAGVALGMNPPPWLKPGDMVELGIEGLGAQRQRVVAAAR